jgi:hypothetical protein
MAEPRPQDTDPGYAFSGSDGFEWSPEHPVRSGHDPYATHVRKMTYGDFKQVAETLDEMH